MTWDDDSERHRRPLADGARASTLQIAATLIGAIFIVSLVLYGLNNDGEEGGKQKTAAPITVTPQPAAGQQNNPAQGKQQPGPQQAQSQQGKGQQPSNPSSAATQPSDPSNPSTTTGQGTGPQGSPNGQ